MADSQADQATSFAAIGERIELFAQTQGQQLALIQGQQTLTYGQLYEAMRAVAHALQRSGIRPGQCVAICAASTLSHAVVFLGALLAGVAVAPLAAGSTPQSLAGMMADAQAKLLLADEAALRALRAGDAQLPPCVLLPDQWLGQPASSQLSHHTAAHLSASLAGAVPSLAQWLEPLGEPKAVAITPGLPFNIIYSSGTTGQPKGIVQSHGMRWAYALRAARFGYSTQSVALLSTPLYSNTTLVVFFPTLSYGGTVVLCPKFEAKVWLELAAQHRATHAMLVPVQYRRLLAEPGFDAHVQQGQLSALRYKFCTSAPFAAALKAEVLQRWPGALVEFYGMTEGGASAILLAHERPDKLHTVGQAAPGHEFRLIDENEQALPATPGLTGELVGRSPSMMTGYHGKPQASRAAEWFDAQGQRFIRTGDVGRFDEEGFLTLVDRRKDMIISGGFNLYPSDLEAVLAQHEAVLEASVVGVPSQRWGETPIAFVVAKPDSGAAEPGGLDAGTDAGADAGANTGGPAEKLAPPSWPELQIWANARLGKTQRLAAVLRVPELPRSAIGKVLKRELLQRWLDAGLRID